MDVIAVFVAAKDTAMIDEKEIRGSKDFGMSYKTVGRVN